MTERTHWDVGGTAACDAETRYVHKKEPALTKNPDEVNCRICLTWIGQTDIDWGVRHGEIPASGVI